MSLKDISSLRSKHAERILKNYRNFKRLANLGGAFGEQAAELIKEVDRVVQGLDNTSRAILINWYYPLTMRKKTRSTMCKELSITVEEYEDIKNRALLDFAKQYRNGVLERLPD